MKIMINDESDLSDYEEDDLKILEDEYNSDNESEACECEGNCSGSDSTRWNRNIPIKVNVFLWRAMLNKLPSKVNLDMRGFDVDSILCPICLGDLKMVNHSFFNCVLAKDLWHLLAKWWEMDIPVCGNFADWFHWLDSLHVPIKVWLVLEGVGGTLMWSIWNFCNSLIFSSCPPKKEVLWDSIVSQSFLWILSRNPSRKFSWIGWLKNLVTTITST
ncbi:RNA-directed DNA polymerase, eukaryota, reverse transcriptase zinc-binding domain protein [Tanacetum coccineum]|uniref:RNA-directed DNA polymerase, eukaryota, reverse transcriptase zinc-binding domain protein n=1 Tax=Tanacetum coccineum TaxID=301880 RepID=A0ABQ4YTJ9_9ASTR